MVIFFLKYIKNGTFRNFLKSKFDPTIHQKHTELRHFKNFLEGICPRTPLAKRMASRHVNFPISKKKLLSPPSKSWLRP